MKTFVSTWKKMNKPGFGPGFSKTLLLLFVMVSLLNAGCRKDIQEPKHKNKGKNVIYLKIDEQEFLIKEGFSLNRNVIRADIGGQAGARNPTYYETTYFGKRAQSLSVTLTNVRGVDNFKSASWDLYFYDDRASTEGLFNSMNVSFFSEKHNRNVSFYSSGYGWVGEFSPRIEILSHNPSEKTISGKVTTTYNDILDSTITGSYYMYFDVQYEE
jgi:hypothetical protein